MPTNTQLRNLPLVRDYVLDALGARMIGKESPELLETPIKKPSAKALLRYRWPLKKDPLTRDGSLLTRQTLNSASTLSP